MKRAFMFLLLSFTILGMAGTVFAETAPDPTGAKTLAENAQAPVDYVWVLVCGFLVMFMQAGFAMVETGFCRAKNATNLMAKNGIDFIVGSLGFFVIGYTLLKGTDVGGFIGVGPLFLAGNQYDVGKYLDFFWQLVFCATAATIVSGAVAERLKFSSYLIYSVIISMLVYPIYGHWVWGGGWLSKLPFGLGHLDFAGSGVVHTIRWDVRACGSNSAWAKIWQIYKGRKAKRYPGP